jgi:hypothetical protein
VFDNAYVLVDTARFNNWLNENYKNLTPETLKGPREHLYYLISSQVSGIYESEGVVLPKDHDTVLEILFSWAERLGSFGGNLVYNQIKSELSPLVNSFVRDTGNFSIELVEDAFVLSVDSANWSLKIPYYFMVGDLREFNTTNNMPTQLAVISTGAAIDKGKLGRSQATLMFLHSPKVDDGKFRSYWLTQFEIPATNKNHALNVKGLNSQVAYDDNTLLHKEISFWSSKRGSFAVAYMGLDGAYQTNREHFINFLEYLNFK